MSSGGAAEIGRSFLKNYLAYARAVEKIHYGSDAIGKEEMERFTKWDKSWEDFAQKGIFNLAPQIPLNVRQLFHARIALQANAVNEPLFTSEWRWIAMRRSPRFECLFNIALYSAPTLAWRIVRLVFRIITLPGSLLISCFMQIRYGKELQKLANQEGPEVEGDTDYSGVVNSGDQNYEHYNIVYQDLASVCYEVRDLCMTIAAVVISFFNMIVPDLLSTDGLEEEYVYHLDNQYNFHTAYSHVQAEYAKKEDTAFQKYVKTRTEGKV